jgi:hypothetical protein
MKSFALFVCILCMSAASFGQAEPLNQIDSVGRQNGKWVMYYDKYCSVVSDSNKASYYCYVYYLHGRRYVTKSSWGNKDGKLVDSVASPQVNRIKLLDGKYTWYDKNGKISTVCYYDKGELILSQWYYPTGKIHGSMDYRKRIEGQPHSGYITTYDKDGNMKGPFPISIYKDKRGKYWGGAV